MTERNTRLLAAIMFTDIQGYTALMQDNEAAAIRLRDRHREVMDIYHKKHKGKIVQYYGDGSLSIFNSCVEAVKCAISIQKDLQHADPLVPLRIGIHLGDIIEREDDIIGNGVNMASRVESLSVPGSVMISRKVADEITNQSGLQLKSMGFFSFKNVNTPTEVLAVDEEGLIVPDGKLLDGKFTKRKSSNRPSIQNLPQWVKYAGGLALLSILVPIAMLFFSPSNAQGETFSIFDETGAQFLLPVVSSSDIKSLYTTPFKNTDNQDNEDWLSLGIPYALQLDLSQDLRISNEFGQEVMDASLNRNLNEARTADCDYLMQGSYRNTAKGYEFKTELYRTSDGTLLKEKTHKGASLFDLIDEVAVELKKSFELKKTDANIVDLQLRSYFTPSEEAFERLCKGILYKRDNPESFNDIHDLLESSVESDSTFAWGHYVLSDFHNTHRINRQVADKHIGLAMKYREALPINQNIQIRLLNYRMKDQQKESLTLANFLHDSRPNDANLLLNLIREYFRQGNYEETINGIGKYRALKGAPNALLSLLTQSLIHLDRVDEAIQQLELVLSRNSMNPEALLWLGKAHLADQDFEDAQEIFEQLNVLTPNQPEVENLSNHISFMLDSADIFEEEFYESFTGTYWAAGISKRSSHEIFLKNEQLYFQFEGSETSERMYPLSRTRFFSVNNQEGQYRSAWHFFLPNDQGAYDRMLIDERGDLSGYMNFEIDEGVRKGMDIFEKGDFEAAEHQFRTSLEEHPNHIFLSYYLQHLEFRKDSAYASLPDAWKKYEGIYFTQAHQYKIFLKDSGLYIQSESNLSYNDPIRLLALDKETFLDSHKLTYQIQFKEEPGRQILLEFINGQAGSVLAKRLR